jgi:hypothetical protein
VERALKVVAFGLLASMLVAALHDVSMAWDVWYYHLPFAARIAGIVPASQFAYDPLNQARFDGFPLFGEALQGLFWRLSGRIQAANLVAFAAVPLYAWLARRRFGVPMYASLLALLAVPLVQIHATSCYVDLPANAAASALVLVAIGAWAEPKDRAPSDATLALAGACAAVAANTKALTHPVVGLALVALGWRAVPAMLRARRVRALALVALALPVVFFTPLKNLLVHHNPYYPVAFHLFGLRLPGPDDPYSSSPVWLAHAPRPVRFLCSVLEIGVRPLSDARRWTVDQWTPPSAPGYRMGGFFGVYAAANLALFAWQAARGWKTREGRAAAIGFGALTAVVSVLPQSHELRYYMGWMMTLVVLNLWLARLRAPEAPKWLALGATAALAAVLVVTRGAYAYPSGKSFDDLVRTEVDPRAMAKVHDGEHVCVRRPPWSFLWAARFHAPKSYAVTEAEAPADCDGAPAL